MHSGLRKLIVSLLALFGILLFGTYGYMLIEEASFTDGLYMTVITITSVGYGETIKLSDDGRYFTIILCLLGAGTLLFIFGKITEAMVEGGINALLGRKNMDKKVATLKNHYIVCGYGRIGKVICQILTENKKPFVVIENHPEELKQIADQGYFYLEGNAANDEVLVKAQIDKARGLIAVVSSDADNVYITLSARGLNPNLFILARSSGTEGTETKLLRAGASKVISPYFIGATRMAQLLVRPTVVDFIDLTVHDELGLRLEELSVSPESSVCDKTLIESNIRPEYDLIIVAIKRYKGEMLFNPHPTTRILPQDVLIVLGEYDNIKRLEKAL